MQAWQAIAHLAFDFGAWRQRGDRIDDENVNRAGADQRIGDFERLFAGIGLRDQQVFEIDAELAGIDRVKRMFGIDEAQMPPFFWASAMVCRASVVLPELSGP